MNTTLLIPFAAKQVALSHLLQGTPEEMPFVKSITGLQLEHFDRIVVSLLKSDAAQLNLPKLIRENFAAHGLLEKLEIFQLDRATGNEPETIARTVEEMNITGPFWSKDPDNFFRCEFIAGNVVTVFPLDELTAVNPQNKSYLTISDADYILNVAEKRIIGRYFCTGGYGFASADEYMDAYKRISGLGRIYLSHVIYRMLMDGNDFRPVYASGYQDWGK